MLPGISHLGIAELKVMLKNEIENYRKYVLLFVSDPMEKEKTKELFLQMKRDIIRQLESKIQDIHLVKS